MSQRVDDAIREPAIVRVQPRRARSPLRVRRADAVTIRREVIKLPYFTLQKLDHDALHHRASLASHVDAFFVQSRERLAKLIESHATKIAKAAEDELLDELLAALDDLDWADLAKDASMDLTSLAQEYGRRGLTQLSVSSDSLFRVVNERARNWGMTRGAELVGMKYDEDGDLVANPNARWNIDETTRDELRELVTQAFEEETSLTDLANDVREAGAFDQARANMIAVTETSRAQAQGSLTAWDESGLVDEVSVMLSADHDEEDDCDDVADGSPYPIAEAFALIPVHPNCECTVVATKIKGMFTVKVPRRNRESV